MFELSINVPDILGCSFGRDAGRSVGIKLGPKAPVQTMGEQLLLLGEIRQSWPLTLFMLANAIFTRVLLLLFVDPRVPIHWKTSRALLWNAHKNNTNCSLRKMVQPINGCNVKLAPSSIITKLNFYCGRNDDKFPSEFIHSTYWNLQYYSRIKIATLLITKIPLV